MKSDSETLRLGLITGLIDVTMVVEWADQQILSDRADEAPALLDLSLASRKSVAEVVSLLGEVPGLVEPEAIGRRLVGMLAAKFRAGEIGVVATARTMCRILLEGYAPDAEFESDAYIVYDRVDLALEGTYGTLQDVALDVSEVLSRFASSSGPMTRKA